MYKIIGFLISVILGTLGTLFGLGVVFIVESVMKGVSCAN